MFGKMYKCLGTYKHIRYRPKQKDKSTSRRSASNAKKKLIHISEIILVHQLGFMADSKITTALLEHTHNIRISDKR